MKIVHLLKHGIQGNGHVHVAVDLACAQAHAGHSVVFAAAESDYTDLLISNRVEVVMIPPATDARSALISAWALGQLLRRLRPDVVHAHMMSSAVLAYPWTRVLRIPLVTTVHNSFDRHSILMRLGDRVLAVSDAERALLISRGYPARKVVTIRNGVIGSARDVLAVEDDVTVRRPSVMTVSGLHPRKAVEDVIAAFALLGGRFPQWHLNVVGWGPDKEKLTELTSRLGLDAQVHFLGSVKSSRDLLQQTDIFATATRAEPGGLAVMEARGAGCAIVATDVGGIPETLEHGKAGLLVPPHAPEAFAAALASIMGDEGALADLRARALDGAEYFSVERMSAEHLALYASVGRKPSRGSARAVGAVGSADHPGPPRRPRLAYFVAPSRQLAGIERVTHEIADGLARTYGGDLDVHVIYSSDYPELEEMAQTAAYQLHTLHQDRIRSVGRALRRCVAQNRLETLIVPQVEATIVAWLSTRGTGLQALVPHLHGNPRVEFDEGTRRSRLAFRFFKRVVSPRVRAVFAVSPSLRDYAARTIAAKTEVVYVPNPVGARPHAVSGWVDDPGMFRIVSVGRLARQKGQDILLDAVAVARPWLPRFSVTIVGGGKEMSALRARSASLGLEDVVTFTGYAAPDEHLARADCFVLASRWEGFGVVLVEALQRGVPLLAADCDFGPRDIITDHRLGTLVRPDDVTALAEGLVTMSSRTRDADEVEVRVQAARQFAADVAVAAHFRAISALGLARSGPAPVSPTGWADTCSAT